MVFKSVTAPPFLALDNLSTCLASRPVLGSATLRALPGYAPCTISNVNLAVTRREMQGASQVQDWQMSAVLPLRNADVKKNVFGTQQPI